MDRFSLHPDEHILMKGDLLFSKGEAGIANYFKGKFRVTECTAFLTSHRFVACKRHKYFPWGPLIWLLIVVAKRKVVFAVPLTDLASIETEADKPLVFILRMPSGERFTLISDGFRKRAKEWIQAISAAVAKSCPGTKALEADGRVEFAKA